MKNNEYYLERHLYRRMLELIRDYDRLRDRMRDLEDTRKAITYDRDQVQTSPRDDALINIVLKYDVCREKVEAIEKSLEQIPQEYRRGVWENITKNRSYPDDAATRTYATWKARFIYRVAEKLGEV